MQFVSYAMQLWTSESSISTQPVMMHTSQCVGLFFLFLFNLKKKNYMMKLNRHDHQHELSTVRWMGSGCRTAMKKPLMWPIKNVGNNFSTF